MVEYGTGHSALDDQVALVWGSLSHGLLSTLSDFSLRVAPCFGIVSNSELASSRRRNQNLNAVTRPGNCEGILSISYHDGRTTGRVQDIEDRSIVAIKGRVNIGYKDECRY